MTPPLEIDILHEAGPFRLRAALTVGQGATVVFGPSGAGKSLLLSAVAGAYRPTSGRIALSGTPVFDARAGIFLPPDRRAVGWVSQSAHLFPHLNVERNLRYGWSRSGGRPRELTFQAVVEALELEPLLMRRTPALSGGEAQRVAIGRALLSQPRLLVLDEPLSALDRPRRREILPFLDRVRKLLNAPLLYVTHDPEEALRLGDRLILMEDGEILAEGEPSRVLANLGAAASGPGGEVRVRGTILGAGPSAGLVRVAAGGGVVLAKAPRDGSSATPGPEGREVVVLLPRDGMVLFSGPPPWGSLANVLEVALAGRAEDGGAPLITLGGPAFALPWPSGAPDLATLPTAGRAFLGFRVALLAGDPDPEPPQDR